MGTVVRRVALWREWSGHYGAKVALGWGRALRGEEWHCGRRHCGGEHCGGRHCGARWALCDEEWHCGGVALWGEGWHCGGHCGKRGGTVGVSTVGRRMAL